MTRPVDVDLDWAFIVFFRPADDNLNVNVSSVLQFVRGYRQARGPGKTYHVWSKLGRDIAGNVTDLPAKHIVDANGIFVVLVGGLSLGNNDLANRHDTIVVSHTDNF